MKESFSRKAFVITNTIILFIYAAICILPIIYLGSISLSDSVKVEAGKVGLLPVGFTTVAYEFIFKSKDFFIAFFNSLTRISFGVPLNMLLTVLVAYPLSRPKKYLRARTKYSWFFVLTMLFSGGLIPMYMLVNALHLNDTILALILPGAVPIFNCILMLNFFKQVPDEFYEAAVIDGASELRILFTIFIPLSLPSIVTILLFVTISHWNSWFDGILYMSNISKYPLQSYLQAVVISKTDLANTNNLDAYKNLSQQTIDAARLFLATIPVIALYVPLQKYFIKGLNLGGVKG